MIVPFQYITNFHNGIVPKKAKRFRWKASNFNVLKHLFYLFDCFYCPAVWDFLLFSTYIWPLWLFYCFYFEIYIKVLRFTFLYYIQVFVVLLYSSICCFTVQYMVNGDIKLFKEIYPFLVLVNKILKMFLCLFLLQVSNNQYFYS